MAKPVRPTRGVGASMVTGTVAKIDESEAQATREFLEMLGEPYEQELAELKGSGIE